MNKVWITLSMLVIALGSAMILRYPQPSPIAQPVHPLGQFLNSEIEGFAPVQSGWQYVFPDDHGAHPDFRMDAWYFTGHLTTLQGQHFGFQMSFVRAALATEKPDIDSAWAFNEIYRAHVAMTDIGDQQFHANELFSRAALGLAGATQTPVRVWLDSWEMHVPDPTQPHFQLRAMTKEASLTLDLESVKKAITNVATGTGNPPFHSYWLPRLRASGALTFDPDTDPVIVSVNGVATLSHVWGGGSLVRGQLALNRFVLQLDDNREILLLQLRRRDGSANPINTGLLIAPDGNIRRLRRQELTLDVLDHWQSPKGGVRYPARWRLQIPAENLQLDISPVLENQEFNQSVRYWAGAVGVTGKSTGQVVSGTGQVELTGYVPDTSQR